MKIWEERNNFAIEKFRQTGDSSWVQNLEPRRMSLEGFIPFMVTDRKELVTIPQNKDTQTIAVCGSRASGKSILLLTIGEGIYYSCKNYVVYLNEMTRESYTCNWGGKQKDRKVIMRYDMFRVPKTMPFVHVIPVSKNARIPPFVPKWKVCLGIKDVLEDPENYLDLGDASHYLSKIKDELLESFRKHKRLSPELVELILDRRGVNKNMINAISARLKRLYDDGILDISPDNKYIDTTIEVKPADDDYYFSFDPLTGLMVAGAIPILHTDHIIGNKRYFVKYLTSQIEKILLNQMEHPYFTRHKKKTYLIIDELTGISSQGKSGIENPVIRRAVVQGRPMGLGTVYATQNPSRIDPTILSNTKYIITCQNSKSEAKVLANEFGLEDREALNIVHMNKNHRECMAFTSEKFHLWDPVANEHYEDQGPLKGVYLFPASNVQSPRS